MVDLVSLNSNYSIIEHYFEHQLLIHAYICQVLSSFPKAIIILL